MQVLRLDALLLILPSRCAWDCCEEFGAGVAVTFEDSEHLVVAEETGAG